MRWCAALSVGVLALALSPAAGRADDDDDEPDTPDAKLVRRELQKFQGTWAVESWVDGGEPVSADELKDRTVFFGANVVVQKQAGKPTRIGSVQLDPRRPTKTFNVAVRVGEGRDGVMLGVYAFDGDALRLAFDPKGGDRPAGLKPSADAGASVVVLKRPKGYPVEGLDIVGKYRSEVVDPDGKKSATQATVERRGDAYLVTYEKDGKTAFIATAIRRGDQLSMCWASAGQVGVSVYKIEKGPKLTGEFTTLTGLGVVGRETMVPWREID